VNIAFLIQRIVALIYAVSTSVWLSCWSHVFSVDLGYCAIFLPGEESLKMIFPAEVVIGAICPPGLIFFLVPLFRFILF
jgi:hypothetical protein